MQAKKTPTYLRTHRLRGNMMQFTLGAEEGELRERAAAAKSGRAARTLVKEGLFRITLVALRKGTALQSHEVAGQVSIQSIRGRLRVITDFGDVDVPAGGLVTLEAGVAHSAKALDDCSVLVTIAMG